ncbi:MAG: ATP-binding protein [Firmicutes bacterium]|nr:ATP-binding protein [Bacillota bacterium]
MAIRNELTLEATIGNLTPVLAFIEQQLEKTGCPFKTQMQIAIAAEEIYVNIARYAYKPGTGEVTVRLEVTDEPAAASLTFIDSGTPFDPLKKTDPDITLSAEERDIGGLGIYMTKKSMDEVRYEYAGEKNVFTMVKNY